MRDFRVSWAAAFPAAATVALLRGPRLPWAAGSPPSRSGGWAANGGRMELRTGFMERCRAASSRARPSLPSTAESPPGGMNDLPAGHLALPPRRATGPQPNAAPICHRRSPKYGPSVEQPHGDGRSRGSTGWKSDEGERIFTRGGHGGGTTGVAKRCAGVMRPSNGDSRGNRRPGPAHLSLPEAAGPHAGMHLDVPARAPRGASAPPVSSSHPADLGGLVEPPAHPSTADFCRSVARLPY